jgi:methionyl-tRNA formyltransferase
MIRKQDGTIDWADAASAIANRVRAFNPWPSAFTTRQGRLLKVHRAHALPDTSDRLPGIVLGMGETIRVATGHGVLAIDELQLEGKRAMSAAEFSRGGAIALGDRLGPGASA